MSRKGTYIAVLCGAILAAALGAAVLSAREDVVPKVEAQHLMTAPLAGEPGKVVDIAIYTFPPGSSVPWHIHPDAHEFEYGLEGTLTIEVEGEPPRDLKTGEASYLAPNVVHRGENKSATETAKIYVVRIKPVGKPLTELIDPSQGGYPGAEPNN